MKNKKKKIYYQNHNKLKIYYNSKIMVLILIILKINNLEKKKMNKINKFYYLTLNKINY